MPARIIPRFRMGVMSGFGGSVNTTFFTDKDAEPGIVRLAAVVLWRRPRTATRTETTPPLWHAPDGWSGARSEDGREVLYHQGRRVVHVLDREYALPSTGEALLLLIDESAPEATSHVIRVHTLLPKRKCNRSLTTHLTSRRGLNCSMRHIAPKARRGTRPSPLIRPSKPSWRRAPAITPIRDLVRWHEGLMQRLAGFRALYVGL